MIIVRASSVVLAGVLVSSMSLASGPADVQPAPKMAVAEFGDGTNLDSLISYAGGLDADAEPKDGIADVDSITPQALAVDFLSFDAAAKSEGVVLRWETASEIDNEGFNLLRSSDSSGVLEVINAQLVPAEGGPGFGAVYEYVDSAVKAKTIYYYVLEDVDTSGSATLRGADACLYNPFEAGSECQALSVKFLGSFWSR